VSDRPTGAPIALDDPALIDQVRAALDRARYGEKTVAEALGMAASPELNLRPTEMPKLARRAGSGRPLDVLVRLLLLGATVGADEFAAAIAPAEPEDWRRLGLVEIGPNGVRALLAILPFQDIRIAADQPAAPGSRRPEFVMGTSASTVALAQMTIRRPVDRALDMACGSGVHALLAASHAKTVVGIDLNARAVNLARFNAAINGMGHVTFEEGDFFGPVEGQRFDLIVANPPFVISPETDYLFRDAGRRGDEVSAWLARTMPTYLNEGGFAQMMCNWAISKGQGPSDRLAAWVEGIGCDSWMIRLGTSPIDVYTTDWLEAEVGANLELARVKFDRWMSYFTELGIEAIGYGMLTLRRREGANPWLRFDDSPSTNGSCGPDILRGFALRDFLTDHARDEDLLAVRLRLNPQVRWEQHLKPTAESWEVLSGRVRLASGLGFAGAIDPAGFELLNRSRGNLTLAEVLTEVAAAVDADLEEVRPGFLEVARGLIEQGFLFPVS
jgi:hypothetical protein